jgi:hypothetical protein
MNGWIGGKKRMHGCIDVNGASGTILPLHSAWPANFQSSQMNYTSQITVKVIFQNFKLDCKNGEQKLNQRKA